MNQKYNSLMLASLAMLCMHANIHAGQGNRQKSAQPAGAVRGILLNKGNVALAGVAGVAKYASDSRLGRRSVPAIQVCKGLAAGYGAGVAISAAYKYVDNAQQTQRRLAALEAVQQGKVQPAVEEAVGKLNLPAAVQNQVTGLIAQYVAQKEFDALEARLKKLEDERKVQ